jgi:predicted nicotinamide N-methyase
LVLSAYLIQEKQEVCGKRVLELGAGTALVSVVAAMLGAKEVLASDRDQPSMIENIQKTIDGNNNAIKRAVKAVPFDYANYDDQGIVTESFDIVLGSDILYSAEDFDDILYTVSCLLSGSTNPNCRFVTAYHERSAHRSIAAHLAKYNLEAERLVSPMLARVHDQGSVTMVRVGTQENEKGDGNEEEEEEEEEVGAKSFDSIHLIAVRRRRE